MDYPNEWLVFKAASNQCSGPVTGVFPVLGCASTEAHPASWGDLKSRF